MLGLGVLLKASCYGDRGSFSVKSRQRKTHTAHFIVYPGELN